MTRTNKTWELPAPPREPEEEWLPVVRLGRVVPFGYRQDPTDCDILLPIKEELDLLEKAKKLLKRYSYKEVSRWLSQESGRTISDEGLRKRIKIESKRQREATNAKFYAQRAEEAAKKAERLSRCVGGTQAKRSSYIGNLPGQRTGQS